MKLSNFAISRPVTTTMLMAAIFVFGLIGYSRLGVDQFPKVEFPVITITTVLPGAGPEVIEDNVTDIIEEQVSTIEGVKKLTSISSHGASIVVAEFELDVDIDTAAQDVRSRIGGAIRRLPKDAEYPDVRKVDTDARPIMWVAVSGDKPIQEVSHFAKDILKPRLETIQGVGSVMIGGRRDRVVRVWLDRNKMEALSVTAPEVVSALKRENIEGSGGWLESRDREFNITTKGEFQTVGAFKNLIVVYKPAGPVKLGDIARVEDGLEDKRSLARYSGNPSSGLGIKKKPGANTIEVANKVIARVNEARLDLPQGLKLDIAYDSSIYVQDSMDEMEFALIFGGILAGFVVFCFLRSATSTIITGITIPLSIVATFLWIYYLDFTLNTMTMLALTLAIGIVIDDSIIVLENIYRHRTNGAGPIEGAREGTSEIAFAAIASTLALVAVFIPVALMSGITGRFFYEFGITAAIATVISTFIALTLTPMLCSKFLKVDKKKGKFYQKSEDFYNYIEVKYKIILTMAMDRPKITVFIAIAIFISSLFIWPFIGKEFIPKEDQSRMMISFQTPVGSTIDYTDSKLKVNEDVLKEIDGIKGFFAAIGLGGNATVHKGIMFVRLDDKSDREMSQEEIVAKVRQELSKEPGVKAFVQGGSTSFGGRRGAPFQFIVKGPDMESLGRYVSLMVKEFRAIDGMIDVDTDYDLGLPELQVHINKEKAAELGISTLDISTALNTLIGGSDTTTFKDGGERFEVRVKLDDDFRKSPSDIGKVSVKTKTGELVKLESLITIDEGVALSVINRRDGQRSITITANTEGDKTLGSAIDDMTAIAKKVLPDGFTTALAGSAEAFKDSKAETLLVVFLALLVTYMVLGAQFESFIHPFTVMLALPLSIIGALGALYLTGSTINIYSLIGLVLLIGLVTKNSIILVDYMNKLKERGKSVREAVLIAGPVRLRPVLMTAFSTIFGVLPTALGLGAGSESRAPMAIATIGGLFTATFLTLIVIPVIYTIFDNMQSGKYEIGKKVATSFGRLRNRTTTETPKVD